MRAPASSCSRSPTGTPRSLACACSAGMRSPSSTATERGDERLAYLQQAELRLRRLDERYPDSSETLGLLGSAAKRMVEMCLRAGRSPDPHLERAIDAYRRGLAADPG